MENKTLLGNSSAGSDPSKPFSNGFGLAILLFLVAGVPVGSFGNLKVCFLLYKRKDLRKVPHILLGNLSLTGLLVSIIYLPLFIAIIVSVQFLHEPIHPLFCVARYSSSILFMGLQSLTLVAMAIDRHDCVVHPFKRRITPGNVRMVLKGIWSVTLLVTGIHFALAVNDTMLSCVGHKEQKAVSLIFILAAGNVYSYGTLVVIFVTFVRIVKRLRSSPFAEYHQNTEIKVTRLSYLLMLFFIISWFPLMVFSMATKASPEMSGTRIEGIKVLLLALSNINYFINPFLHMQMCKLPHRSMDTTNQEIPGQEQQQQNNETDERGNATRDT